MIASNALSISAAILGGIFRFTGNLVFLNKVDRNQRPDIRKTSISWRGNAASKINAQRTDAAQARLKLQNPGRGSIDSIDSHRPIRDNSNPLSRLWVVSSAGRAPRSQCGGRGFDPPTIHQTDYFFCSITGS
jgi:hypothetical protein